MDIADPQIAPNITCHDTRQNLRDALFNFRRLHVPNIDIISEVVVLIVCNFTYATNKKVCIVILTVVNDFYISQNDTRETIRLRFRPPYNVT